LITTFKRHDEKRLYDDYKIYTDQEKMRANALSAAVELEELFTKDVQDLGDGDSPASGERRDDRESAG